MWKKISILGPGLLGGSVAKALRVRAQSEAVSLWGRRQSSIAAAITAGFQAEATTDLAVAVAGADLILLATPIGVMENLLKNALPHVEAGAHVTDLGSVKGRVVRELEPLCDSAGIHFVGSHPMAGSEKTGFDAGSAELFQGAPCILTPTEKTPEAVIGKVQEFWQTLGCTTGRFAPDDHDQLVARISHLPHLAASAIIEQAARSSHDHLAWAGGGLRDTTRIAAGDVPMWTDIFLSNHVEVARQARELAARLEALAQFLDLQDESALAEFLSNAKTLRDTLGNNHSSKS